jgi:hypothetical protein
MQVTREQIGSGVDQAHAAVRTGEEPKAIALASEQILRRRSGGGEVAGESTHIMSTADGA